MVVIRKGVERIGSYKVEKTTTVDVSANGIEKALFVYAIPPFAHMGYCHSMSISAVGWDAQEVFETSELALSGRIVNITESNVTPLTGDNWDDYLEDYAGADPDTILSGGNATDVGLEGGEVMAAEAQGQSFFSRSYKSKIGKNAYNTDASKIRYLVECGYKGHLRTPSMVAIAQPKLMVVGATAADPSAMTSFTASAHDATAGSYTTWRGLYDALVDNIPSQNVDVDEQALGDDLPETGDTMLKSYLHKGKAVTNYHTGDPCGYHVRFEFRGRLDIYRPTPGNYVPGPTH